MKNEVKTTQGVRISLHVKKNERSYEFTMPYGCPPTEAHSAAIDIISDILGMQTRAEEMNKQQEQAKKEEQENKDNSVESDVVKDQ
jgi:hypothetical protein